MKMDSNPGLVFLVSLAVTLIISSILACGVIPRSRTTMKHPKWLIGAESLQERPHAW